MIHIILILTSLLHPFFVSVTDINQNTKSKTLEVSSKIFCNDLEADIFRETNIKVDMLHPKDKLLANKLIANYVAKHIQLKLNDKPFNLNYIGYENVADAIWVYLESNKAPIIRTFEIRNNVLLNLHPEQANIINLKTDLMEEHFKTDGQKTTFKFSQKK